MKKRALITGASRGIGAETARLLAREGYDLFLVCRNSKEKLEALKGELVGTYGICCDTALLDVSQPDAVSVLKEQVEDIPILINNAAVSYVGLVSDMSVEAWRQVIDTNLSAVFYFSRLLIPGMVKKQEGKIINVSSVWGNVGASMEAAYSASKGGVNSFTRALAKELAPSHIQVNAVAFGVIDTDMNACFSKEELLGLTDEIPADRLGTPQEAAKMIFQVLTAPDYFTGQVVTMDGGWI